jgi:transposase
MTLVAALGVGSGISKSEVSRICTELDTDARYLRRNGLKVIEVSRPPRQGERRLSGKSDTIDAEHAARQVLAGTATATPKLADGIIEAIRLMKIARDTAVKAHSTLMITLKATLVTASDEVRADLEPLTDFKLVTACAALSADGDVTDPSAAMRHVLGSLARRWLELHEEIKVHSHHLKKLTMTAAPDLVAAFGIGPDIAAEMLVTAGDNNDRIRSDAALAKLCGACSIPAGSGKTNGRHRLNRGGNRQANAALYRAIIVRMRWHPPTIAYVRTAHRRGPLQAGDHPLPQALPRSRDLQPAPRAQFVVTELAPAA